MCVLWEGTSMASSEVSELSLSHSYAKALLRSVGLSANDLGEGIFVWLSAVRGLLSF